MKTLALILTITLLNSTSAIARSLKPVEIPVETAELTEIYAHPSLGSIDQASITIGANDYVYLKLTTIPECLKEKRVGVPVCAVIPSSRMIRLPIEEVFHDVCNTRVIVAKLDQRPVDGPLEEIVIHDNRTNVCLNNTTVNFPMTSVQYTVEVLNRISSSEPAISRFTGEALRAGFMTPNK